VIARRLLLLAVYFTLPTLCLFVPFSGAWQAFPRLAAAFFFVLIGPGYLMMKVRQPVCEVPSGPGKAMTRSGLMDFPSAAHSSTRKASRRRALIAARPGVSDTSGLPSVTLALR
jgi:hypothetical protein